MLVTGSAGFVGAVLGRRLLADGHEVTLVVGPETDLWRVRDLSKHARVAPVDLRDADAVRTLVASARPEVVFHLAAHGAYSWQQSLRRMIETNVNGFVNVTEAAISAGARAIVNAGSSSEYGLKDHAPPEDELPEPNSAYSFTKASATLYGTWVARARGQAVTTLRLYSAYGPFEEPRRLMPTVVLCGMERRLPPLVDPRIARDFVYVEDVADAFVRAAERARPGEAAVYNVGSGVQTTLADLAATARRVFSIEEQPAWGSFPARQWDTDVWVADARRIAQRLDWRATTSLEAGLAATAGWLRDAPGLLARYREALPAAAA